MLVDKYVESLFEAFESCIAGAADPVASRITGKDFADLKTATGANDEDIAALKAAYPDCPQTLIDLLQRMDGTFWRRYVDHEIIVPVMASLDYEYANYLLSVKKILESQYKETNSIAELWAWNGTGELDRVDRRIDYTVSTGQWLHFTNCVNNGGISRLYIDFNPFTEKGGIKGQIVEYSHDPDKYDVIADSFDEYLENLINSEYVFLDKFYRN